MQSTSAAKRQDSGSTKTDDDDYDLLHTCRNSPIHIVTDVGKNEILVVTPDTKQ